MEKPKKVIFCYGCKLSHEPEEVTLTQIGLKHDRKVSAFLCEKCKTKYDKKHYLKENNISECPKCLQLKNMKYPALSRRDNKTQICSDCGIEEAFEDCNKHAEAK